MARPVVVRSEDSLGRNTQVIDPDTGYVISKKLAIQSITLTCDPRNFWRGTMDICMVAPDISVPVAWRTLHPLTETYEEIAAIEYADGTRMLFFSGKPQRVDPRGNRATTVDPELVGDWPSDPSPAGEGGAS